MKGRISLKDFIQSVKSELLEAGKAGAEDPYFALKDIELETEFSVEAEGKAGIKFFVDLEGTAKGAQTHRVKLSLQPIPPAIRAAAKGETDLHELAAKIDSADIVKASATREFSQPIGIAPPSAMHSDGLPYQDDKGILWLPGPDGNGGHAILMSYTPKLDDWWYQSTNLMQYKQMEDEPDETPLPLSDDDEEAPKQPKDD